MTYKNLSVCCIDCHKDTTTSGLANHWNRIHGTDDELKKKLSLVNLITGSKSREKSRVKSLKECEEYYSSPRICIHCNNVIDFFRRKNKFCSTTCAATSTNKTREARSAESRKKTSDSLKAAYKNSKNSRTYKYSLIKTSCVVCFYKCSQCDNIILSKSKNPTRKTCSRECGINASTSYRPYINGKRKNIYYTTISGQTVLLESSWELEIAEFLDKHTIQWIRPKYIKWIDSTGKQRNYYPDFYLPDYDLYLDPKNPYCMTQDQEKMKYISSKVTIWYGDKDAIKATLLKLLVSVENYDISTSYSQSMHSST